MSSSKRKQIALTSDSMFIVWTRFINMLACDNITPLFGICIFTGGDFPPGTVCIYIYMYMYIYIYVYVCVYIYMYICMYTYLYICLHTNLHTHMFLYMQHLHF